MNYSFCDFTFVLCNIIFTVSRSVATFGFELVIEIISMVYHIIIWYHLSYVWANILWWWFHRQTFLNTWLQYYSDMRNASFNLWAENWKLAVLVMWGLSSRLGLILLHCRTINLTIDLSAWPPSRISGDIYSPYGWNTEYKYRIKIQKHQYDVIWVVDLNIGDNNRSWICTELPLKNGKSLWRD